MVFVAAAAYSLLSEHRAHFFGAWPFLILLACPLMHVFMHHGHGHHGSRDANNADTSVDQKHMKKAARSQADGTQPEEQA